MNWTNLILSSLGAGEISGIIIGVIGALSAAIIAIIKALGEFYAAKGCTTCPITKRDLKPTIKRQQAKKAKKAKKAKQEQNGQ